VIDVPSSSAQGPPAEEPIGTSRLRVTVRAPVAAERAAHVLGDGRGAWLGELVQPATEEAGTARYLLDLELRVSDAAPRVAFHKAAYVDVGPLRDDGGLTYLDISWRAAGMTPLFPVFAGRLAWNAGELWLDGHYAPPGGGVGAVADRLLLNVAARATGRRLLERIAEVMAAGD
jgi:hypothetical protein